MPDWYLYQKVISIKKFELPFMYSSQNHQTSIAYDILAKFQFHFDLTEDMCNIGLTFKTRRYHFSKLPDPDIDFQKLKKLLQQKNFQITQFAEMSIKISLGFFTLTFHSSLQNNQKLQKSIKQQSTQLKVKKKKQLNLEKTIENLQKQVKLCLSELGQVTQKLEKCQKQNEILKKQNQELKTQNLQIYGRKSGGMQKTQAQNIIMRVKIEKLEQKVKQNLIIKKENDDLKIVQKQVQSLKEENERLKNMRRQENTVKELIHQIEQLKSANNKLQTESKSQAIKIKQLQQFINQIVEGETLSKPEPQIKSSSKNQQKKPETKILKQEKSQQSVAQYVGNYKKIDSILYWNDKLSSSILKFQSDRTYVFLHESDYVFRSVISNVGFSFGVHYWQIIPDARTSNQIKIGVACSNDFDMNFSFSDYDFGFAFYGKGELRHGSNKEGTSYGKRVVNKGIIGVFLNMDEGTLAFSIDGESYGIAFRDERLMKGPIYPAVSLLHIGGCSIVGELEVPEIFYEFI